MKEKKQKRMFVVCVVLVILMTALAGCKKQESISRENESNENETMERDTAERETAVKETGTGSLENLREAPLLYLIYEKDGNARKLELKSGSFNWMYDNGDGTKQGSIADADVYKRQDSDYSYRSSRPHDGSDNRAGRVGDILDTGGAGSGMHGEIP